MGSIVPPPTIPALVTMGDDGRIREPGQISSCNERGIMALGKTIPPPAGESTIIPLLEFVDIIGPAIGVAMRDPDIGVEEFEAEPRKSDGRIICCW